MQKKQNSTCLVTDNNLRTKAESVLLNQGDNHVGNIIWHAKKWEQVMGDVVDGIIELAGEEDFVVAMQQRHDRISAQFNNLDCRNSHVCRNRNSHLVFLEDSDGQMTHDFQCQK